MLSSPHPRRARCVLRLPGLFLGGRRRRWSRQRRWPEWRPRPRGGAPQLRGIRRLHRAVSRSRAWATPWRTPGHV